MNIIMNILKKILNKSDMHIITTHQEHFTLPSDLFACVPRN